MKQRLIAGALICFLACVFAIVIICFLICLFALTARAQMVETPVSFQGDPQRVAGLALQIHSDAGIHAVQSEFFENIAVSHQVGYSQIAAVTAIPKDSRELLLVVLEAPGTVELQKAVCADTDMGYPAEGELLDVAHAHSGRRLPVALDGSVVRVPVIVPVLMLLLTD